MNHEDWFQVSSYYISARKTVIEYHQFPLWSPYFGGGFPLVGHPEDISLSPLFLPVLLFGETISLKVIVIIIYLLAALGMYLFCKEILKFKRFACLFTSLTFTLTSYLPFRINDGDFHSEPMLLLLPLLFYFYEKSIQKRKFVFLTSLFLVFLLFTGAFAFLYIFFALLVYSILSSVINKKIKPRYTKNFILISIFLITMGAIKIIPSVEIISTSPNCINDFSQINSASDCRNTLYITQYTDRYFSYTDLIRSYIDRNFKGDTPTYTGIIPLFFFILGAISIKKKNLKFLFFFLIFSIILLGNNFIINFHSLFLHIHLFNQIIKIDKYLPPIILFSFCIISGSFLNSFHLKVKKKLIIVLSMLVVGSLMWQFNSNIKLQSNSFDLPKEEINKSQIFYQIEIKNITQKDNILTAKTQYYNILNNKGTLNWYSSLSYNTNVTPKFFIDNNGVPSKNIKYKGKIYFLNNNKNQARINHFSPNKIIVEVNASEKDLLILNMNYNKNWKSNLITIGQYNGLLSLNINKMGQYNVVIKYLPFSFFIGLIISFISITLGIYLYWLT
jgi:hypothetical protein